MPRMELTSTIGPDGVLTLSTPVGSDWAGRNVRVTVETVDEVRQHVAQVDWERFVDMTAGAWHGELERPPQGEYEQREPWT